MVDSMKRFSSFKVTLIWCAIILFVLPGNWGLSQSLTWESMNGPYGGRIFSVGCAPNGVLLAASENCGIFRSTDEGESWQQTSLTSETIVAFAVDSRGRLFAGSSGASGVYVSSDAGLTWLAANSGLESQGLESLVILSSGHIFAGTFYRGIYKSTDGGANWTRLQLPISGDATNPVWAMCADSSGNVYAGVAGVGLFRSSDDGRAWVEVGFHGTEIDALISLPHGEILAGAYGAIFRSTDRGATWTRLQTDTRYVNSFAQSATGHIFAFADNGVLRSTDEGLTWTGLNVGFRSTRYMSGSISSKGFIYGGNDGEGIARSTDDGNTWQKKNTGLAGSAVWVLASTASGRLLAGTDQGLHASDDRGATWILSDAVPGYVHALSVSANGFMFVSAGTGIFRSIDAGLNWRRLGNGAPNGASAICADEADNVFASPVGSIYRSTDAGGNWTMVDSSGHLILSLASSGLGEVYAGTFMYGMNRSTDGGTSWVEANNGIPAHFSGDRTIVALTVIRLGDVIASTTLGQFIRSTDQGKSWKTVADSTSLVSSILEDQNGRLYAGSRKRILGSTNHGASWFVVGAGPGNHEVRTLAFDSDGYLLAGAYSGGVFRSNLKTQTTSPPRRFELAQNYPNPFNSSTIIGFSLAQEQNVKLKIYNLLGQEIATLLSDHMVVGDYEFRWYANVPSGVYFYRLQAGDFVETKKMILLK